MPSPGTYRPPGKMFLGWIPDECPSVCMGDRPVCLCPGAGLGMGSVSHASDGCRVYRMVQHYSCRARARAFLGFYELCRDDRLRGSKDLKERTLYFMNEPPHQPSKLEKINKFLRIFFGVTTAVVLIVVLIAMFIRGTGY